KRSHTKNISSSWTNQICCELRSCRVAAESHFVNELLINTFRPHSTPFRLGLEDESVGHHARPRGVRYCPKTTNLFFITHGVSPIADSATRPDISPHKHQETAATRRYTGFAIMETQCDNRTEIGTRASWGSGRRSRAEGTATRIAAGHCPHTGGNPAGRDATSPLRAGSHIAGETGVPS